MRKIAMIGALLIVATNCVPAIPKGVEWPWSYAKTVCDAACLVMSANGCTESNTGVDGVSCAEMCSGESLDFPLCIASATSTEGIRACGVKCRSTSDTTAKEARDGCE